MRHAGQIKDTAPPSVSITGLTKRFGDLTALDGVSIDFQPGSFHALLGENGAGKSTLVKCLMGTYRAEAGTISINGRVQAMGNPRDAQRLGLGMVYQHFTLVPSMTVAENLVLGQEALPSVINWSKYHADLDAFMREMPFRLDLDRLVTGLSAGEKQKLEILKQLYLGSRFLILDEPTSVLTPDEADQILGQMRELTQAGRVSIVLISHKLREVEAFADEVSVLRQGRLVGQGKVSGTSRTDMIGMMVGHAQMPKSQDRTSVTRGAVALSVRGLCVENDKGVQAVASLSLDLHAGEIIGIAGVSGNGQTELVEALAGQRSETAGEMRVAEIPYAKTRKQMREHKIRVLPEDPLNSACVRQMSVAENLSLRIFDESPIALGGFWLNREAMRDHATDLIARFGIKTQGPDAPIETLSGGNVQRSVLARELSQQAKVLIVQNPCFGLDLKAVAEIRSRIVEARNGGAAVLLISEDLDEIFELSDRIMVMSSGKIVFETQRAGADLHEIGRQMASHGG